MHGLAEGEKLKAFLDHTAKLMPDMQKRVELWKILRKTDALDVVSKGNAKLFFTPNDCNLSIESHEHSNDTSGTGAGTGTRAIRDHVDSD